MQKKSEELRAVKGIKIEKFKQEQHAATRFMWPNLNYGERLQVLDIPTGCTAQIPGH